MNSAPEVSTIVGLSADIVARMRKALASPSLQRLENTIPIFRAEMESLKKSSTAGRGGSASLVWAEQAKELLCEAEKAVKTRNAERGWRCLKAADRFTWQGLATAAPDLLQAKVEAIANEAEDEKKGVTKWRRESIKKLLKDKEGKLVPVSSRQVDKMIEAKRLLDEHYDNVYQRLAILKTRLKLLFFLGLAFLGLWFVVLPPVPLAVTANDGADAFVALSKTPARFWAMVVLAGLLGALISAFTSAIGTDPKQSSIPTELSTLTLTAARLMVGSLSALAITLFLSSGTLSFEGQNYAFLIAIAIVSGFSDRFLLSAIEKVTKPG
jgi:hypothetical protein